MFSAFRRLFEAEERLLETAPDHGELGWDRLRSGYGIGLRILAPGVNEIRVDVALSQFGDFQFHFGAWPKFVAQTKRLR